MPNCTKTIAAHTVSVHRHIRFHAADECVFGILDTRISRKEIEKRCFACEKNVVILALHSNSRVYILPKQNLKYKPKYQKNSKWWILPIVECTDCSLKPSHAHTLYIQMRDESNYYWIGKSVLLSHYGFSFLHLVFGARRFGNKLFGCCSHTKNHFH